MKTAGIIAEYNPFHQGHQYHIAETRRQTGCDFVIALISGDFVQRGAPAIACKYDRTRAALVGGADLVNELPKTTALSKAEGYVYGGISLLSHLGVVEAVSCGCETPANAASFDALLALLCNEPPAFKEALSSFLKEGVSFPKARQLAAEAILGSDVSALLSLPNNILALEYAKAIEKKDASLTLCRIQRKGAAYHETEATDGFPSATALRKTLLQKKTKALLCEADFSALLYYALLSSKEHLADFGLGDPALAARTAHLLEHFSDWPGFAALLKTKSKTYTAISRYFCHVLLQLTCADFALADAFDAVPFVRVLGMKKEAAPLLFAIRQSSDVPLLVNLSKDVPALNEERLRLWQLQVQAAELCRMQRGEQLTELRRPLIVL